MRSSSQLELTVQLPSAQGTAMWKSDASAQSHLKELLKLSIVLDEDFQSLLSEAREKICSCAEFRELWSFLLEFGLVTQYQADRIGAGNIHGLILGQYHVLDRLGAGGMGVVFKAEHMDMRRLVAIKVLPLYAEQDPRIQQRFISEIRTVAQLQHPNIVAAIDSGIARSLGEVALRYFVMELVPGEDLEECVNAHGPLAPAKACDIIHQIAAALDEAHKHNLVHRYIKQSNIRLTPDGQAKLLDFGLTRRSEHRMTEPGIILGTLDFMAPEQTCDAGSVDIRADIFALGGTMFWCLTGKTPSAQVDSLFSQIAQRRTQPPPSVRTHRPEVPEELDEIVQRMMALDPSQRYDTPRQVMRALLPFLKPEMGDGFLPTAQPTCLGADGVGDQEILIVDDQAEISQFCRLTLEGSGLRCDEAPDGPTALEMAHAKHYDLVLLDIHLPGMEGPQVCQLLRQTPPSSNLKIIMMSGLATSDEMARMLLNGADDYLSKPISMVQLQAKVKAALHLKEAQDRTDLLNARLLADNGTLEQTLRTRDGDLVHVRNALVRALAKVVEHREGGNGAHLARMECYVSCLAEEAAKAPQFSGQIDSTFIDLLACCAPLHDLGKVGLPDHILLKPGKLDSNERILMQAHTTIGSDTLKSAMQQHGESMAFLQMAADITRYHHEHFDGSGYPDKLEGFRIPLSARIVAIADVYDALRSRRSYKPALSQAAALEVMMHVCSGQFDPNLMQVFCRCAIRLERIFRELPD
jgi:response regulator RpfG family c-di-GMP phosphodiesterase/tRNA A-37 threonylcarbamoyl transferase component Bud32